MTPALRRLQGQLVDALGAHLAAGGRPRPPEAGLPLWNAFLRLSRARTFGPAGPNPIGWAEIEAWARLVREPLEAHHVEILVAMDEAWLGHAFARQAGGPAKVLPAVSREALTPALFDAAVDRS